jgi:hypothetical protein
MFKRSVGESGEHREVGTNGAALVKDGSLYS